MEVWKPIPEYEGLYEVSSHGRIKSLERDVVCGEYGSIRHQYEKILSPEITRKGYLRVSLCKNKGRRFLVHKIVASVFLGLSELNVNHKDLNKANNNIDNLEYVTNRENRHHYLKSINRALPIGVRKMKSKYQVRITKGGLVHYLGVYQTQEEAGKVFQEALLNIG